jgi:predicted glycosyltransferase
VRVLIDILHPAHVHFFRNFHAEMKGRGHELLVTARAKECSTDLLERYALPYQLVSRQQSGLGLARELLQRTSRIVGIIREFRPDVLTGIMGPSIALAGTVCQVPAVIFYDTEFASQTNWFTYPLADSVCTPDCYQARVRGRHVTYAGYHELAYLHPRRFTPDPSRLTAFGLEPGEPYTLLRFVALRAVHDISERGLTDQQRDELVRCLQGYGRVLISSEGDLSPALEHLRVRGPVEDIHHLIAHAQLLVGESATMASEAAVLGVPAVYIATTRRGYTDDEERRYGLVRYFPEHDVQGALGAIAACFSSGSPRVWGAEARQRLLAEKIDVTDWMVDFFHQRFGQAVARQAV